MRRIILLVFLALISVSFVYAQYKYITLPPIKVITTTTSSTTTLATCSAGCQCMTEVEAEEAYLKPTKCGTEVCGYYISQTPKAIVKTPKYCFKEGAVATTTTTTTTIVFVTTTRAVVKPVETGCTTCESCNNEIRSGKREIKVAADLSSPTGTCIRLDADNVVFDCRGHKITGYGTGLEFYYGMEILGSGNTIRNCTIEGFEVAIATYSAKNNLLEKNTIKKNRLGVWLGGGRIDNRTREVIDSSDNNRLLYNTIIENEEGIHLAGCKSNIIRGNRLCRNSIGDIYTSPYAVSSGNIQENNVCDLIYNWNSNGDVTWCATTCTANASTSVGSATKLNEALSSGDYGTISLTADINAPGGIHFNRSHVTLNCGGHWITGSGSGVGIEIKNKVNVELRECGIRRYETGVLMDGVSHSRALYNGIKENDYGLIMKSSHMPSRSNNISSNTIGPSNRVYGVYLDGDVWDNNFTRNEIHGGKYSLYTNARCDNTIEKSNKIKNGRRIGYYHDIYNIYLSPSSNPPIEIYGELILCNVNNSYFIGAEIDNEGDNTDGVIVRNSHNTNIYQLMVRNVYEGVAIINSSNIRIEEGQIAETEKDGVSIHKSSRVLVGQVTFRDCERGIYLYLSNATYIGGNEIRSSRTAAIESYMSDSSKIRYNTIRLGAGPPTTKGIVLGESSDENEIEGNDIQEIDTGIFIDPTSRGNQLKKNVVCSNSKDIYNQGTNNTGRNNTCSKPVSWSDKGTTGCLNCCNPPVSDINNDGVDDACDCFDALKSINEIGVDCGGKCSECIACDWCGRKIEPLRIKGRPNEGMIDVVFVPHESFRSNMTTFRNDAIHYVRNYYLKLDDLTEKPIPEDFEDRFNFYYYNGGYGSDGQCAGELPGEKEYTEWLITCSVTCGLTLGLGCACFAFEPEHFYGDAGWCDTAAILTMNRAGCANTLGPQSHFISERAGPVVIHESGHAIFGLVDEYCGHTYYTQQSSHPNVWSSLSGCRNYARDHEWTLGDCRQIMYTDSNGTVTCSKGYYRYDPDSPTESYMIVWGSGWNYRFWEAAAERINYVFEHYPGGGSRGILVYINQDNKGMKKIGLTVVSGHPDLGLQEPVYWLEVLSAGNERVMEFGLWDHRRPLASGPDSVAEFLENVTFPINIPFESNPRWLNIFNASSGELVLSIDLGPELYGWCSFHDWEGDDCRSLDIDNNGVPDWKETTSWRPQERLKNMSFSDRPEIPEEIRKRAAAAEEKLSRTGFDLNLIIASLIAALFGSAFLVAVLLVVIAVLVVLLWKKKKK